MKVTAIVAQIRQSKRFSIFVDGIYNFSLSESALLESGLVRGQEVSTADIRRFKQLSEDDVAYGRAVRYLSMRPRSEWEVRDYLRRKQTTDAATDEICEKLIQLGLLNDKSFALAWVHGRRSLKATSRRKLTIELQQKHIASDIIDEVLAEDRAETDEIAILRQLIERKRSRYPDERKLIAYLIRQGYSYGDVRSALKEAESE